MTRACWEAASKVPKPSARRKRRCLQPSRNGRVTSAGSFLLLQNLTFQSLKPGTKEFTLPCRLCL